MFIPFAQMFKSMLVALMIKHLDTSTSFSEQEPLALDTVRDVLQQYALSKYPNAQLGLNLEIVDYHIQTNLSNWKRNKRVPASKMDKQEAMLKVIKAIKKAPAELNRLPKNVVMAASRRNEEAEDVVDYNEDASASESDNALLQEKKQSQSKILEEAANKGRHDASSEKSRHRKHQKKRTADDSDAEAAAAEDEDKSQENNNNNKKKKKK